MITAALSVPDPDPEELIAFLDQLDADYERDRREVYARAVAAYNAPGEWEPLSRGRA